jgi:hypothetical protein
MGRRRTHAPMAALALGVVLAFATVSTASGGQRSTTKGDHATSPAGLLAVSGELSGIAATHGVAWAVGYSGTRENSKALTLYWNGHRWQREANPSPPGAELSAVAATSPTDVWAVGTVGFEPNPTKTLILHWTGKKWVETPRIPGSLSAVAATSPTNAWAVGGTHDGAALILHWNGQEWRQMPSPAGNLNGVAATSPTNAWAVGATSGGSQDTLILHWNGEAWQQTPSPSVGGDQGLGSILLGVEASPDRPVLAVGDGDNCGCGPGTPLVERWNRHTWGEDSTSQQDSIDLSGVAALPTGRAWAVGQAGSGDGPTNGVILEWNGSAWTSVPVPGLESQVGGLSGVAATSRSNAWAVGWESPVTVASSNAAGPGDTGTPEILILHWNGSAWTPQTTLGPATTPAASATTTTTLPPTTTTFSTTTTTPPTTTTTPPSTPAAGGPLLGSAAWVGALGFAGDGVEGFGEVAPAAINAAGGNAPGSYVNSISWSNWGAPQAMGQGQSTYVSNPNAPLSDATQATFTVVAFDLGSCNGGPPAYEEVEWYSPGQGQTFDPSSATNACTGQ